MERYLQVVNPFIHEKNKKLKPEYDLIKNTARELMTMTENTD